jgi:hypothetical protein
VTARQAITIERCATSAVHQLSAVHLAIGMAVFDAIEAGESAQLQLLGSTFAKARP